MSNHISDIVIVIPSLAPDRKLIEYTKDLIKYGFTNIIIVNDGSSNEYEQIFSCLNGIKQITVLKHAVNKGKGAALKTAFLHIKNNNRGIKGILAVDSDGQHLPEDCKKLLKR